MLGLGSALRSPIETGSNDDELVVIVLPRQFPPSLSLFLEEPFHSHVTSGRDVQRSFCMRTRINSARSERLETPIST